MIPSSTPEHYEARIAALEEKLEDYRLLVNNTPDLLYRTDLKGRITFVSPAVEKLSGFTVQEALGMHMAKEVYLFPEQREEFLTILRKDGRVRNYVAQLKRKDGTIWWASTNAHIYRNKQGQVLGVEGIARDVSELKNAEMALQKSEELFRLAFHTSPDSINLNRTVDGVYIDINEGFSRILGYSREDVIGKSSVELQIWRNLEDRARMISELQKNGYVQNLEAEFVTKDGNIRTGLMSARCMEVNNEEVILSITKDITDYKFLERQLQQAQKFEAIGTLAGGIAHDFNNLLMGIQGNASLLQVSMEQSNPLLKYVRGIEEYVQSAARLTQQLLGIARRGKYEICPVNIGEVLTKSVEMFARARKELRMHCRVLKKDIIIEADQQQLEQVFLNIFVNAWQAMPDGGQISVDATSVVLSEDFCVTAQITSGEYCKISISDTGIGMDEQTKQRAFDPFFTTKEVGRGTGLGLASALGIIKNHGGTISISSELNNGTTITIYLPVSDKVIEKRTINDTSLQTGSGHVLLVDDEALVAEVSKAMLESLGYKVSVANSGMAAVELLSRNEDTIDLIILDLIMQGMDGEKTFEIIRRIQPDVRVLLSSGYSINGQVTEILKKGCDGFIQKPFNIAELSKKIREIMVMTN